MVLADEADPVGGERRPFEVVVDGSEAVVRSHVEVLGRPDGHDARHRCGVVDVDRRNRSVGDVAAHEHRMEW